MVVPETRFVFLQPLNSFPIGLLSELVVKGVLEVK